jgi:hypothetical protein
MTMQGPSEPSMGTPTGAIPQPPPGGPPDDLDPSEALRLSGRSGDTAVVFRLNRDVPLLHRLAELATDRLEWLIENRRMVAAGGVALVAVVALAATIGGAYRGHPLPITPAAPPRPPVVLPLSAEPAPAPAAAVPAPAPAAAAEVDPAPAARPTPRPRKPRVRATTPAAVPRKTVAAPSAHPGPRLATPPARW